MKRHSSILFHSFQAIPFLTFLVKHMAPLCIRQLSAHPIQLSFLGVMLFIHQDLQGDLKGLVMGLASFDSSAQIVVASGSSYLVKQNA